MESESTDLSRLERLLVNRTGGRLTQLQRLILQRVWQGLKYREIAEDAGYTEGHIKDVGSDLWKLLSGALDAKVTKSNCKAVIKRSLQSAGLYQPGQWTRPLGNSALAHLSPEITPIAWDKLDAADIFNPIDASPVPKHNCWGRSREMAQLGQLRQQGQRLVVVQGSTGVGKTTLAQAFFQDAGFEIVLELLIAKSPEHIINADRIVDEWLQQDFAIEPGPEFGVSLARLKRQLEQRRVGILIDNLESALDNQGQLISSQRHYVELFRVLADARVQGMTLMTSRDRLCEMEINLNHYRLTGLNQETWQQYLIQRGITAEFTLVQAIWQQYQGNTKALSMIAHMTQTDYQGDLAAYWAGNHDRAELQHLQA
jgi:hypothetical protein